MLQVNTVVPALCPYGNTNSGIYGKRRASVYMRRGKISTKKEIWNIGPRPPQRSFD